MMSATENLLCMSKKLIAENTSVEKLVFEILSNSAVWF